MSEQPAVSVIIVNFNGGAVLTECVHNVLGSTLPVEVFIVDNASTDTSLNQLRREIGNDPRVAIIENPLNLGFATANNIAVERTSAPWVLFLNPDCVVRPDTLERMREVMLSHPKAGMSGALILNTDGTEQKGCRRRVPTPWRTFVRVMGLSKLLPDHPWFCDFDLSVEPLPKTPVPVDAISGSFMFTRREAIDRVGLMDEEYFLHCEDLDWCMRFRQAGYDVLFASHVPVTHYKGVCGRRRPVRVLWHMHRGMVRFYRKFFQRKYSPFLMWAVMLAVWLRFSLMAAYVFLRRDLIGNLREAFGRRRERLAAALAPVQVNIPVRPGDTGLGHGRPVVVTGASGQIGVYLVPRLVNEGFRVFAVSREQARREGMVNVAWLERDLGGTVEQSAWPAAQVCFHLAPIWLLPAHIGALHAAGVQRIVAFSSTSVVAKRESDSRKELDVVARLDEAEAACARQCEELGIRLTVLRPTMIYGCGMDKTVTAIATFIRRFRFFPIAGRGVGLRQPVHAQDLAEACLALVDNRRTWGRTYNLSGGETLSYRRMVEEIFQAMGRRVHILTLPLPLLRGAIRVLRLLPGLGHLTPAMATRMDQDLCFSHEQASKDFDFAPRRFLATPAPRPVHIALPARAARARLALVTGATGFIGSAICDALIAQGRPVRGLARRSELAGALPAGVEACIVGDIVKPVNWTPVVSGVDCVVHLAGYVHETPSDPLDEARARYARLNVEATRRLANAAARAGVRRLVYISSVKVHGEKTGPNEPLTEQQTPAPVGPYAETKLEAEKVLREIERTTGMEVVIVRPPLVYGPGVKANFLRLVRSVDGGLPLPLAAVRNQRSFIYLGNLVDVLIRCMDDRRAAGETFLVSDGEDVSTPKLIRNIAFCLGKQPNLVQVPVGVLSMSGGLSGGAALINRLIDSLVIDSSHVTETLDWRPPFSMLEGLQATVDWYVQAVAPLRSPRGYAAGAEFGVRAVGMQAG